MIIDWFTSEQNCISMNCTIIEHLCEIFIKLLYYREPLMLCFKEKDI